MFPRDVYVNIGRQLFREYRKQRVDAYEAQADTLNPST